MKKGHIKFFFVMILIGIIFTSVFSGFTPIIVNAQGTGSTMSTGGIEGQTPSNSGTFALQNPLKAKSLGELVKNFIEVFSYVAILFAVLVLVYIGFSYVMASAKGDAGEIQKLHSWLLWTVVGVAVVIGARVIVEIVINTLNITGTLDPAVIQSAKDAVKK